MSIALLSLALFLAPQAAVADSVMPPAGARVVHVVEGRGVQIYECKQQDAKFAWVFVAPEAKLFDRTSGEQVGTHGAGPQWTWKDGSSVSGVVKEKVASSHMDSVPWLLLEATPKGDVSGALTGVAWVRRSETKGGNAPPSGCDAEHKGAMVNVLYTATYSFYSAK